MARILVTGGNGFMGRRAVRALLERGHEVVVGDRQGGAVEPPADFIELDVADAQRLIGACEDSDVILNFVGPYYKFGTGVAEAAIAASRPYVDVCDDADTTAALLELDAVARRAGIPVVVGAGMSPGVVNALAQAVAADFEHVESILTAWVIDSRGPGGTAPLYHFFHGISEEIPIWRGGRREFIHPFSDTGAELFPFPEPIGPLEVRDIGHPEPVTLPRALSSAEVRNKGAILPPSLTSVFRTLAKLGMLSDAPVVVGEQEVCARDFTVAVLSRRSALQGDPGSDHVGLGVRVVGTRGGRPSTTYVSYAGNVSMADATSVPAASAVDLLAEGGISAGVHGPEVLGPAPWFSRITEFDARLFTDLRRWEGESDDPSTAAIQLVDVAQTT